MRITPCGRWLLGWICAVNFIAAHSTNTCFADLLAGDFKFNSVFRFDDETGAEVPGGIPMGTAGLEATAGVAVGPDGNIYVSSQNTGEILFYNGKTGAPLPSPLTGGRDGLFALLRTPSTPGGAPGPLRFGPNGNLYVSDFGGSTVRVYQGTTGAELAPAATGFGPTGGLTFAPNGDLYVGNFGTSAVIRVRNGTQTPFILSGTGPILTPSSLLVVPNGDLLVVSMFANQIHRYSGTGEYLGVFAHIEPIVPPVDVTNYPSEIVFDDDGNVVVAVLGATNPPDNAGQVLRYALQEGSVEGLLLDTLVDAYPPISSIVWIRSPDAVTGDFDSNGVVDATDYNKWRSDFGKWVANGGGADGNSNGVVDAGDYVVWRDAFSNSGPSVVAAAVPEPAANFVILCAAWLSLSRTMARQARATYCGRRL